MRDRYIKVVLAHIKDIEKDLYKTHTRLEQAIKELEKLERALKEHCYYVKLLHED